jgi:hypothetical protein
MSTLKVNKLRDTAGSADAITLDPNGGAVLAGVTTVTSVKVGAAVTISESGIEASGIGITVANINGAQLGGRKNIIINGAMNVAQRGTSSTSAGYETVDRIETSVNDLDEVPTFAQVDVASGTTPYTSGFRKAFKMTNGNQTGGAETLDKSEVHYKIEAQDIANSGWNYTSSSSFVTLSFWVKSSVAQNFFGHIKTTDGTAYNYPFETGSLTADTWTKVVKTIPGNSNLQIDNDTGVGLTILFYGFMGTALTGSVSLDTWAAYVSSTRTPDQTSTWHTTNDATLEFTGLQLEVGSQATPFEHRSFNEELALCQRYYQICVEGSDQFVCFGDFFTATQCDGGVTLPVEMKSTPTIDANTGANYYLIYTAAGSTNIDGSLTIFKSHKRAVLWYSASDSSKTAGDANRWITNNASAKIAFDAEL